MPYYLPGYQPTMVANPTQIERRALRDQPAVSRSQSRQVYDLQANRQSITKQAIQLRELEKKNRKLEEEVHAWKKEAKAWPKDLGKISPAIRHWCEHQEQLYGSPGYHQMKNNRRYLVGELKQNGLMAHNERYSYAAK